MRTALRIIVGLLIGAAAGLSAQSRDGHLVLLGGGPTPAAVFARTLQLSGGPGAIVAVLPQTYPNDSIGDAAVSLWKQAGAREVLKISRTDSAAARAALQRATLIWMPGGFQGVLMSAIGGTAIPDVIRARFAAGVTIGGASAGAAVMSRTMIADENTPDGGGLAGPATSQGLGLWPEALVSPHFTERRRMNALTALLREHGDLLGIGLDEGSAVIVSGGEIQAMGRGTVVIVDPRGAYDGRATSADGSSNDRPVVRTLKPGMRFRYRAATPVP